MLIKLTLVILFTAILSCPDVDNCARCNLKTSKCDICIGAQFDLKSGNCDSSQKSIPECNIYSHDEKPVCRTCVYGFGATENGSKCAKCDIDGCAVCNNNVKMCQACYGQQIISLNGEKCVIDESFKQPDCQVNYNTQNSKVPACKICEKGFTSVDFKCLKETVKNCAEMEGDKCFLCRDGFYQTIDNTCAVNGTNKHKKLNFYIFLLLLLIVIACAGAFWYYKIRPQENISMDEPLIT